MEELLKAIKNSNDSAIIKKKVKRFVPKEIFSDDDEGSFFDIINKVKPKRRRSSNIDNWNSVDFLSFMKEETKTSLIGRTSYDCNQVLRLRDSLTFSFRNITGKNDNFCDNSMLKRYLDWWLDIYKPIYSEKNEAINTNSFCSEKTVRNFFKTGPWMPLEIAQSLTVLINNAKPSGKTYEELYFNGGLKKLIYDAGIVLSFDFLVSQKNKSTQEAIKEMKKTLLSLHQNVFEYVVEKTFKMAPYKKELKIDVKALVNYCISKFELPHLLNLSYETLFGEK